MNIGLFMFLTMGGSFMKRIVVASLIVILTLCLLGCSHSNTDKISSTSEHQQLDGVTMKTIKQRYSNNSKEIKVLWINDTEKEITFGELFHLEKIVNGKWEKAYDRDAIFESIGLPVEPKSQREHTYSITTYTDSLDAGNYRIATEFYYVKKPGDYETYTLYADFIVE